MDMPFLAGLIAAAVVMGIFGYLLDRLVLRGIFGQPQFAMVILTIALGFLLRFFAGVTWGYDPISLESPFAGRILELGGLTIPMVMR
jgi:branched-chain amino acid transport system permease protein